MSARRKAKGEDQIAKDIEKLTSMPEWQTFLGVAWGVREGWIEELVNASAAETYELQAKIKALDEFVAEPQRLVEAYASPERLARMGPRKSYPVV